jgi:hypothetical protein
MKKVYIYGTGSKALQFLPAILLQYQVIGFLDSNKAIAGSFLLGLRVFHLSEITSAHFDHIVIASSYVDEINKSISDAGFPAGIAVETLPKVTEVAKQFNQLKSDYEEKSLMLLNLPRVPLHEVHIADTRLITNRNRLLELLPHGGIVAEVGVANGDFSSQIISLNTPRKLHLVDIWQGERFNDTLFHNVRSKFNHELAEGQVEIHRKLSTEAVYDFPDNYFDWVYIDTSHCYKGTKAELELYSRKVKPGGIIAGHDYTMGNWGKRFRYGVMEAVHEFCVAYGWRMKYLTMDLSENQSFAIEKIPQS